MTDLHCERLGKCIKRIKSRCCFKLLVQYSMINRYSCSDYQSEILQERSSYGRLNLAECALDVSKECCKYICIMSNSLMGNFSHCDKFMLPAYLACQADLLKELDTFNALEVFRHYQHIGTVASAITVACCLVVFLISLYCNFYSQWAEQIILSKTLFVFGFGVCLLTSFRSGECNLETSVTTLTLILGDILWTCVLLAKLVYTVRRPFQHSSFLTGIVGNWAFVVVICSAWAVGVYFALKDGVKNGSTGAGYLQSVPICLVHRLFAEKETSLRAGAFNYNLFMFIYLPYILVVLVNITGLVYIWRRFSSKDSQRSASFSARLRVLRTIKQYLASYFVYTFCLIVIWLIPFNVHTCSAEKSTYKYSVDNMTKYYDFNNKNKIDIVQFPPSCASWNGFLCNPRENGASNPNAYFNGMQILFFSLFCLRGVPDLIVFFFLNKNRIIELIRGRE